MGVVCGVLCSGIGDSAVFGGGGGVENWWLLVVSDAMVGAEGPVGVKRENSDAIEAIIAVSLDISPWSAPRAAVESA
jgi:hypothetical protein